MQKQRVTSPVTLDPDTFNELTDKIVHVVDCMILESALHTTSRAQEYHVIGFEDGLELRNFIRRLAGQQGETAQ